MFLIPIGPDLYEPYFEPSEGAAELVEEGGGWLNRQKRRVMNMLREAEAERHVQLDPTVHAAEGFGARWRRKSLRWMVERAAEQRLLWHLRTAAAAVLIVPSDLAGERAMTIFRHGLKRDSDRHRRWFVANLLGLLGSLALIILPGPNLLGYYFTFTTVGHMLAWRGAQQGLQRVNWRVEANPDVTDIRAAVAMDSPAREHHLHDVASRLGLRHLATFVARLAVPPA
ncbi:MAG: hypothetical protein ABI880_11500 [Acidobacteriota bacterium]